MPYMWRVSLKPHLTEEQKAESPYAIGKKLGISKNTVKRYMESDEEVITYLSSNVGAIARHFGIDEHKIINLVEVSEDVDEEIREALRATG